VAAGQSHNQLAGGVVTIWRPVEEEPWTEALCYGHKLELAAISGGAAEPLKTSGSVLRANCIRRRQ